MLVEFYANVANVSWNNENVGKFYINFIKFLLIPNAPRHRWYCKVNRKLVSFLIIIIIYITLCSQVSYGSIALS
jgi:hypothetical protein